METYMRLLLSGSRNEADDILRFVPSCNSVNRLDEIVNYNGAAFPILEIVDLLPISHLLRRCRKSFGQILHRVVVSVSHNMQRLKFIDDCFDAKIHSEGEDGLVSATLQ